MSHLGLDDKNSIEYRIVWPRRRFCGIDCPIRSTGTKVIAVYVVGELAVQLFLKASLVGSTTYGSSTKCTNTGLQSFSDFALLFNILKMHIIGVELYRYAYVIKPQTFF